MIALLLALVAQPAVAADREFRSSEEVLANFQDEPDVREVQLMVLDYSRTDPAHAEAWERAARNTYLVPEVQLAYGYKNGYDRDFVYADGETETLEDSALDVDNAVVVKARWRFDKVLMSSERIRVISESQDMVKTRDKILETATRVYFDRRRLQVEMLMGGGDVKTQLKNELRLQELTAQLDAYTGGRFSQALPKR